MAARTVLILLLISLCRAYWAAGHTISIGQGRTGLGLGTGPGIPHYGRPT